MRVQPRQHRRYVVRPVLPLQAERGRAGDPARQLAIRAGSVRVRVRDLPESGQKRRGRAQKERARTGPQGELGRAHQQRGGFRRQERDESEPVLEAAEDGRGREQEGQERRAGEAQLEQPLRVEPPSREIDEQVDAGGGEQRDQRQGQRHSVDHQRVDDGEGRSAQDLPEVPPRIVDVVGMERDPVAEVAQRLVPEQRPGEKQHHRREENERQCLERGVALLARKEKRVHEQNRWQEPRVVLHRQREAVHECKAKFCTQPEARGPRPEARSLRAKA